MKIHSVNCENSTHHEYTVCQYAEFLTHYMIVTWL